MKDNFSIDHNPLLWRNQLLKCIHDTFYVFPRSPPRFPLSPLVHNVTGEEKWSKVYLLYFLIIALWCKMCRKCLGFCHLKTLESVHMHCVLGKSLSRHFTHLDAKNSCVTKVTVKSRKTQKTCLFFFHGNISLLMYYYSQQSLFHFFSKEGGKKDVKENDFLSPRWPSSVWTCSDCPLRCQTGLIWSGLSL